MSYTELAQAYEDGTEVEYRWQQLLNDPGHAPYWPLLRALRADPVLGELSPSTSHRNFVRLDLGWARSFAQVHIIQLREDFQVQGSWDMRARRAATVAEAVALAAALAASLPPATAPD